jgi:hypothetical protein
MLFIEKLKGIRKRPSMYMANVNLREAISFVSGMDLMLEKPTVLHEFSKWLCSEKLKIRSGVSWEGLVPMYIEKQGIESNNQVEAFFDLLFEFFEDQKLLGSE